MCSHFGIEAYPYAPVNGGEWENGASGYVRHHPCKLFISSASSFLPSSSESLGDQTVSFRDSIGTRWGLRLSGSSTSVVVDLFRCAVSLTPGNLGTCTPCIRHSCVNRDFRNVMEAWTRHASLHVSEKREITGRFRQSLPPRDLPGVVLHP